MAGIFGGYSSFSDGPIAADGGNGSGVPRRHNVEGLRDLTRGEDSAVDKKFTEDLHSRKNNGKFEPSSLNTQEREKNAEKKKD